MKMKKIAAAALTAVMLISACLLPASALNYGEEWQGSSTVYTTTYSDVPTSHWAYENIMRITAKEWFHGYPDGTFRPNAQISRSEAVTVFVQFLSMEVKDVTSTSFYDVDVNKWYAPYVEAGKDLLPVHTVPGGKTPFRPEQVITREDTIYALLVALGYDTEVDLVDESILNMFKDQNSISRTMRPYVAYAVKEGFVSGRGDSTIGAQDPLTRAEFATLLYRGSMIGPNDGHEAKLQSVSIEPSGLQQLKVGESFTVKGTGHYTDGSTKPYEIYDAYNADSNGIVSINQSKIIAEKPGNCEIKFKDENLKDKSIVVIVTKESGEVSLNFSSYSDSTYDSYITISGTARDSKGDTVTLSCNNKAVAMSDNGSFSYVVELRTGRNDLEFVARNSNGTSVSKSIVITRKEAGQVSITLDRYSSSTYSDKITLSGKVNNTGSGTVTLTCNGQSLSLDRENTFSREFSLRPGDNTFNFEARNEAGVKISNSITIVRQDPGTLTLTIDERDVENPTTSKNMTITGSVYNSRGGQISLTCNGDRVSVNRDGTFSTRVDLQVGRNTFEFEAENEGGATISKSITIERQDPGTVTLFIPETDIQTSSSYVTISGIVVDSKGGRVTLTCDGTRVNVGSDGKFEVTLSFYSSSHEFEFVAENEYGVTATETVSVEKVSMSVSQPSWW